MDPKGVPKEQDMALTILGIYIPPHSEPQAQALWKLKMGKKRIYQIPSKTRISLSWEKEREKGVVWKAVEAVRNLTSRFNDS